MNILPFPCVGARSRVVALCSLALVASLFTAGCDADTTTSLVGPGSNGGAADGGGAPGAFDASAAVGDDAAAPGGPTSDAGGSCGALTRCNGACVDTASSNTSCGLCGHTCLAGFTCQNSACTSGQACAAPAGAPADATTALTLVNAIRAKMGSPCAAIVPALDTSATKHCAYYKANASTPACVSNAHVEASSCSGYVADQFYQREAAAGYGGQPSSEDMAFVGDPALAVGEWVDSVWHRSPLLSPWVGDFGYGSAAGCDTADFGVGQGAPDSVVVTYPYDGQAGIPTDFSGNEGPRPPAPPSGFPSGYPIHVFLANGVITAHTLTLDGSSAPIPHVFLAPSDVASMGLLRDVYVMYANAPLQSGKRYRVHIAGTQGSAPLTLDWAFTTR